MDFETSKKLNEAILSDGVLRNLIGEKQNLLSKITTKYIVNRKQNKMTAIYSKIDMELLAKIDEMIELRKAQIEKMFL